MWQLYVTSARGIHFKLSWLFRKGAANCSANTLVRFLPRAQCVRKHRASQEMNPKSPSSFGLDEYQVASSTFGEAEIHIAQWIFAFLLRCSTRLATTSGKIPGVMQGSSSVQTRKGIKFCFMYSIVFCLVLYPPVSVRDWLQPFQPVTLWPHRILDRWKLDFSVQEVVVRWHSCLSLLKNQWIMLAYSASPLK